MCWRNALKPVCDVTNYFAVSFGHIFISYLYAVYHLFIFSYGLSRSRHLTLQYLQYSISL